MQKGISPIYQQTNDVIQPYIGRRLACLTMSYFGRFTIGGKEASRLIFEKLAQEDHGFIFETCRQWYARPRYTGMWKWVSSFPEIHSVYVAFEQSHTQSLIMENDIFATLTIVGLHQNDRFVESKQGSEYKALITYKSKDCERFGDLPCACDKWWELQRPFNCKNLRRQGLLECKEFYCTVLLQITQKE